MTHSGADSCPQCPPDTATRKGNLMTATGDSRPVPEQPNKRVEVVVLEDGKEVERQDLDAVGYVVLTAEGWEVSSMQCWASGTAQFTVKRVGA